MGFKKAKQQVIECLKSGHFEHEARDRIEVKNRLATGAVTVEEVIAAIGRSRGDSYSSSPHHFDASIEVHIIKTTHLGTGWYIKWYFVDPNSVFISVH